jgi:hypothetical protein
MASESNAFPEPIKPFNMFNFNTLTEFQRVINLERTNNIFRLMANKIDMFEIDISMCRVKLSDPQLPVETIIELVTEMENAEQLMQKYNERLSPFRKYINYCVLGITSKWNENWDENKYLEYLLLCSDITVLLD